jgi:hypothetical protein
MRTRNNLIQVYLSDKELEKLNRLTSKSGLTRSSYIRQLIAGLQPRERPPVEYHSMMRQLFYCGNSLNQIARKAHGLGVIDVEKYDEAVMTFRNIVGDLNKAILEPERMRKK